MLAPEYKNQKIYKNFTPFNNEKLSNIKLNKYRVTKVREIDWCFCIINRNKVKTLKLLDENYFMYFETIDLCKNLINKKHKFYIIKGLTFDHLGTSSSKEKFKNEILLNRNWHFSWSKFYFLKKITIILCCKKSHTKYLSKFNWNYYFTYKNEHI